LKNLAHRVARFFGYGGTVAWVLIGTALVMTALSTLLFFGAFSARYQRNVTRLVVEDDLEVLEAVKYSLANTEAELAEARAEADEASLDRPYIAVSIEENQLWYKHGDRVLFNARVATGSGKTLVREGGTAWKFETPRGRLVVRAKEEAPVWVPPDWHFVEQAKKRGVTLTRLEYGQSIATADGGSITVSGNDVVKRGPDGSLTPLSATDGREIVADGRLIMPPLGANQRRYEGVLGTHRLVLGDGYALHGTNQPDSIGRAVSHGCVRLRNEDIAQLFGMVAVGTPVYIY
jgi:hypothetical protein